MESNRRIDDLHRVAKDRSLDRSTRTLATRRIVLIMTDKILSLTKGTIGTMVIRAEYIIRA